MREQMLRPPKWRLRIPNAGGKANSSATSSGPLPFRPVALDAAWLAWNNGTVGRLAQAAYEGRQMPAGTLEPERLAVLGDAMQEAGCEDPDILGHLRDRQQVHVRGCFVLDLLLGKS
jgi:hypothetical protein